MEPLRGVNSNLAEATRMLQSSKALPSLDYKMGTPSQDRIVFGPSYAGPWETVIDAVTTDGRTIKVRSKEVPQSPSLGRLPPSSSVGSWQPCSISGDTMADEQELRREDKEIGHKSIMWGEYIEANKALQALKSDRERRERAKVASSGRDLSSNSPVHTSDPDERKPTRSIEFVGPGWVAEKGSLLGNFSSEGELRAAISIMVEGGVPTPEEVTKRYTREQSDM